MRAEGGLSCPSSKMVRFFSFFHYIILISTTLPQATPTIASRCDEVNRLLWRPHPLSTIVWNPGKQVFALVFRGCGHPLTTIACQQPTTLDIEHSRSFLGVAGFLWPPPPINNPTSPEIERSRSFSEVVGFLWASATATTINNPPEPSKSSVHARFRVLLPLQPPKSSVCARCGPSLPAATTTTAQ